VSIEEKSPGGGKGTSPKRGSKVSGVKNPPRGPEKKPGMQPETELPEKNRGVAV